MSVTGSCYVCQDELTVKSIVCLVCNKMYCKKCKSHHDWSQKSCLANVCARVCSGCHVFGCRKVTDVLCCNCMNAKMFYCSGCAIAKRVRTHKRIMVGILICHFIHSKPCHKDVVYVIAKEMLRLSKKYM